VSRLFRRHARRMADEIASMSSLDEAGTVLEMLA
jgi:hypothetical protein